MAVSRSSSILRDGLYTVSLIVHEGVRTETQSELLTGFILVLQDFLLHDINRMRRPTDTSGDPRRPITKKVFFRNSFPAAGDTPSGEVVI